jgi:hypothetical protein
MIQRFEALKRHVECGHPRRRACAAPGRTGQEALIVDGVAVIDRQLAVLRGRARNIVLVGFRGPGRAVPVSTTRRREPDRFGARHGADCPPRPIACSCWRATPFTAPFVEYLATLARSARAVVPVSDGRWHPLCAMYARDAAAELSAALDAGERTVAPR